MKLKKKYVNLVKIVLFITITILLLMLILNVIKTNHKIKYKVGNYSIEERFNIINNKNYYDFIINDSKNRFIFSTNNNYHKSKKIISKIITNNIGKTYCIMPIYKNNRGEVLCNYNKSIVSLYYLSVIDNSLYKKIVKNYKDDGYDVKINNSDKISNYKNISIYKDNIDINQTYTLWNYKGIFIFNNNGYKYKKLLKEDKYENELASLVGKYYVFIDTNNKYNGFKLYYYDIEKDKLKVFDKTKYKIDDDISFCGIYDNNLYIYDRRYKKQYRFDPNHSEIKKVGDKEHGFYLLKNNKLELVDYYEFKDNIYFNIVIENKELNKKYNVKKAFLINNYYYIYSNEGYFYKVSKNDLKNSVILFKIDNISGFIIKNNRIIFSLEDNLYSYDEFDGLKNIIKSEELNYNYNNIYDYYEKN